MISYIILIVLISSQLIISLVNAVFYPVTKPIISFCAGESHGCAVFDNHLMKCWGHSDYAATSQHSGFSESTLGDNLPYFNPGTTSLSINQITCHSYGTCMLLNTGDIKCMGNNREGQAGIGFSNAKYIVGPSTGHIGDTLPVVNLGTGIKVANFTSGGRHICVFTFDKKVKCHGKNDQGQLGLGDVMHRGLFPSDMGDNLPFIDFGTNVEIASVHSGKGSSHTCVILSKPIPDAQRIKCWGRNDYSQLGYGDTNNRGDASYEMGDNLTLVDLGTESRVKQIALGYYHSCILLYSDMLKCFGRGYNGQLGSGSTATISTTGNSIPFVTIDAGKTIKLLSTGWDHTCIVYDDMNSMKCFGMGEAGQIGQGDKSQRGDTPSSMIPFIPNIDLGTGSLKISSIQCGGEHTCVIFEDYNVKCFGIHIIGQLASRKVSQAMGDDPGEMGVNLTFSEFFSPTQSPTLPTKSPTNSPSINPTSSKPTSIPTITPTKSPTNLPTDMPTIPTNSPSISPTIIPTRNPIKSPSKSPTLSPTIFNNTSSAAAVSAIINNIITTIGITVGVSIFAIITATATIFFRYQSKRSITQLSTRNAEP